MKLKHSLFIALLALLSGNESFARIEKSPEFTLNYKLIPSLGYHLGISELTDQGSSLSQGPVLGLKLRMESNGYYTAPDVSIAELFGLDKSPATLWSLGLIVGGMVKSTNSDVYLGISTRNFIGYKVSGAVFGRLGGNMELVPNKIKLYLEAVYGQFTRVVAPNKIGYPYIGTEGGVEFPFAF